MKTLVKTQTFDIHSNKRELFWIRWYGKFEMILSFSINNKILCLDLNSTYCEIGLLYFQLKFWTE